MVLHGPKFFKGTIDSKAICVIGVDNSSIMSQLSK